MRVARLYWEWSEIDGGKDIEKESRRQICMGYYSEEAMVNL